MTICFIIVATCAKDQTILASGQREIFLAVKKARERAVVLHFIIMRYRKIEICDRSNAHIIYRYKISLPHDLNELPQNKKKMRLNEKGASLEQTNKQPIYFRLFSNQCNFNNFSFAILLRYSSLIFIP